MSADQHVFTQAPKKARKFHWSFCRFCGLVFLKNEVSRREAVRRCPERAEVERWERERK